MHRIHLVLLLVCLPGLLTNAFAETEHGTIVGNVIFAGQKPKPNEYPLRADMQKITGKNKLTIQTYQTGTNGGLANCVVALRAKDRTKRTIPAPLERAVLHKDGPSFVPRLLVMTPGTILEYHNKNSPCKCFHVQGTSHGANPLVAAGERYTMPFEKRDTCTVSSNLRPYMQAWIHVMDTPHYAITNADGNFEISSVPAGKYRIRVWHEGTGWNRKFQGPSEIDIRSGTKEIVRLKVKPRPPKKITTTQPPKE